MAYFKDFPTIQYSIGKNKQLVTDILVRAKFSDRLKEYGTAFSTYSVKDRERPEHVANRFYGSPDFSWIVLLANEIQDPFFEWCMSQQELTAYCEDVYGKDAMFFTRHFERNGIIIGEYYDYNYNDPDFIWIPPSNPAPQDPNVVPVSHYEFEERKNEERREIRIIRPELVQQVVNDFKVAINE